MGRFGISKVIRIERQDDRDAISEKWGDYSYGTISKLFEQGRKDTLRTLIQQELFKIIDDNATIKAIVKSILLLPLKDATKSLEERDSRNIEGDITLARKSLNEFISEVTKYRKSKDLDNSLSEECLTLAKHITKRLNPNSWNGENLDGVRQQQYSEPQREEMEMTGRYSGSTSSSSIA
jgi:hypothetical protein